jgi:hypothetical protein
MIVSVTFMICRPVLTVILGHPRAVRPVLAVIFLFPHPMCSMLHVAVLVVPGMLV